MEINIQVGNLNKKGNFIENLKLENKITDIFIRWV